MSDPSRLAADVLDEVGFDSLPICPADILAKLQIPCIEMNFQGVDGTLVVDPNGVSTFVGINKNIREAGRKNFTCAHEIGHFCMDVFGATGGSVCSKSDIDSGGRGQDDSESKADRFASELLMPKSLVQPLVQGNKPSWETISSISEKCETTLTATARRLIGLTDESCVMIVSGKDGRMKYFVPSDSMSLYLGWNNRMVPPKSFAAKALKEVPLPTEFSVVSADTWFDDRRIPRDAEVLEFSLPLNRYGEVLTIVWEEDTVVPEDWSESSRPSNDLVGGIWEPPRFYKSKRKP